MALFVWCVSTQMSILELVIPRDYFFKSQHWFSTKIFTSKFISCRRNTDKKKYKLLIRAHAVSFDKFFSSPDKPILAVPSSATSSQYSSHPYGLREQTTNDHRQTWKNRKLSIFTLRMCYVTCPFCIRVLLVLPNRKLSNSSYLFSFHVCPSHV